MLKFAYDIVNWNIFLFYFIYFEYVINNYFWLYFWYLVKEMN